MTMKLLLGRSQRSATARTCRAASFGSRRSTVAVQVLFQLSPATPHGCRELRESMSRACGQQMRELRHIRSKEGVKKTSWPCAELLEFAP